MAQTDLHFTFEVSSQNKEENTSSPVQLDVLSFKLEEALNKPFLLDVELISHDPEIDFALIVDQPALFTIHQQGAPVRHIHGLISSFEQGKTGFRRTHYFATVEPALARTRLSSDWRIFQQNNSEEIMKELFKANQISNVEISSQQEHIAREYCVQPGALDFEFIQRLSAQEGYVYRIDSAANSHRLLITDIIQTFGSIKGQVIYNASAGGDKPQPALRSFNYSQRVRTAKQTQRDYTFKNPRYSLEHQVHGQSMGTQSTHYEQYDYGVHAQYKQDAVGNPFTNTKIHSLRNDACVAIAMGDDARIQPGLAFEMTGHARQSLNSWWRPVKITHTGTQHTASEEEAATANQSTHYEQRAELVLATDNWKADIPTPHLIKGPLIAHVTGPEGEEIYVDEYGRVKVKFPWDREGSNDEHSSCWIRVTQNWAGAGWGHIAIPRIGQEVIVEFLGGDQDQPIITGRTYDANHPTPYKLPALKAQNTVKSKEHKGSGYNELLIDDTTGEIKTQLHTTHEATQLSMGYLTHPRSSDGSGEQRGDGFELRTDTWGAIRAGKGLYLSADKREKAQGKQLDLQEAIQDLQAARSMTASLREAAQVAKAELADLQKQTSFLQDSLTDLKQAALIAHAPDGIALASPKIVQAHAGENLIFTAGNQADVTAMQKVTISAGDSISLFAVDQGMKLIANRGDFNLEAQNDAMNLTSSQNMTLTSGQGEVEVNANKKLLLSCGGAYIKIENGQIELGASMPLLIRTPGFSCIGPNTIDSKDYEAEKPFKEFFTVKDKKTGTLLPYARYRIKTQSGEAFTGRTDRAGKTMMVHTAEAQNISVELLGDLED